MPWAVHFTPADEAEATEEPSQRNSRVSLGLHVDTNNCRERRWLTFIIYLQSTPPTHGGHTLFPLAQQRKRPAADGLKPAFIGRGGCSNGRGRGRGGASGSAALPVARQRQRLRLVEAARVLQGTGLHHTGQARNPHLAEEVHEAAQLLLTEGDRLAEAAVQAASTENRDLTDTDGLDCCFWHPSGCGLAVSPRQGSCVAFFTRNPVDGTIDPQSWHGGADVRLPSSEPKGSVEGGSDKMAPTGKWALQKFREVPVEMLRNACCIESFAQHHGRLVLPCLSGGVSFELCREDQVTN
eukprot:TRINITY_DN8390_c3_g1_i1.p1 TRINITY_DN8390_c3_g1~~TRINITY_DN8390_c3_g1_i1.p1  ORF type:complete len:296 (+),score=48.20 TRINITY_DN8390_c3_g1_i1:309-1196(+)